MAHSYLNQDYQLWMQQLCETSSVVSCMLVNGAQARVMSRAGLQVDRHLTNLINKFYADVSLRNSEEQLVNSEKYYHLTRVIDKKNRIFVHVIVRKRKIYLPLVRLKVSNLAMCFSFSAMVSRATSHSTEVRFSRA